MILYHFLYDVFIVYGKNPFWTDYFWVQFWQQAICWTFIFISGFVWILGSKKNFWRGLYLNLCGFVISFVTKTIIPSEAIWFGILNFIGCAVLLMFPLQKVLKRLHPVLGTVLSFCLFILCKQIPNGFIGIGKLFQIHLPSMLYSTSILTIFGFPFQGFVSSDYFPILPWMFLYLCGYFVNKILMEYKSWEQVAQFKIPILSRCGRKTIWIYMLHQPVIMLLCFLLFH